MKFVPGEHGVKKRRNKNAPEVSVNAGGQTSAQVTHPQGDLGWIYNAHRAPRAHYGPTHTLCSGMQDLYRQSCIAGGTRIDSDSALGRRAVRGCFDFKNKYIKHQGASRRLPTPFSPIAQAWEFGPPQGLDTATPRRNEGKKGTDRRPMTPRGRVVPDKRATTAPIMSGSLDDKSVG